MAEEVVFDVAIQQLFGTVGIQRFRQASFTLRRRQAIGRIVAAQALAIEVLVEAAHRREQARQAFAAQALLVQAGDQAAQAWRVECAPVGELLLLAIIEDLTQVQAIGAEGVR